MSQCMTKPTKLPVCPAKTQISLGICQVWSVFTIRMKKAWVLSYPLSAQRSLWSDWADAQADLSHRWAHRSFCWFCHVAAQIIVIRIDKSKPEDNSIDQVYFVKPIQIPISCLPITLMRTRNQYQKSIERSVRLSSRGDKQCTPFLEFRVNFPWNVFM